MSQVTFPSDKTWTPPKASLFRRIAALCVLLTVLVLFIGLQVLGPLAWALEALFN